MTRATFRWATAIQLAVLAGASAIAVSLVEKLRVQ